MSAMSSLESNSNQEKKIYDETQAVVGSAHADPETQAKVEQVYDPSQESIWTRLGLNFESYKRAPGSTR
jgi:amino acid transporter